MGARPLDGDTWAEAGNRGVAEVLAGAESLGRVVERFPKFVLAVGVMEIGRHDADDLGRQAVEVDRAIENAGISAEASLPERITEHSHAGSAPRVELFGFGESAADEGRDAECREKAGCRAGSLDALGFASFAREIEIGDEAGEREEANSWRERRGAAGAA